MKDLDLKRALIKLAGEEDDVEDVKNFLGLINEKDLLNLVKGVATDIEDRASDSMRDSEIVTDDIEEYATTHNLDFDSFHAAITSMGYDAVKVTIDEKAMAKAVREYYQILKKE